MIGGPGTVAGPAAAAYVIAGLAHYFDIPPGVQLLAFAGVLAAAGLRDPRHVLGPAFSWNPRPANPSRSAPRDGSQ
jgi:ABC-type branched-subunit amino acid transport system permease subunit